MVIKRLAPIAIPVFDRPHHFKACIESLKKNAGADKTTLYVSSDGPRCDTSRLRVQQVRDYIGTINGFKKVIVFSSEENTRKNIWFETRQKISDENERFIVSEDDNVFSPFFLKFINEGLEIFSSEEKVAAICGYNYPGFPFLRPEAIALRCFAGWGYGTWREKDLLSKVDIKEVASDVFSNVDVFREMNAALPHVAPMLRNVSCGKLMAGDVTACALLFKEERVCIFPSRSLVRNLGHDGTGEHCGVTDTFAKQPILFEKIVVERLQSYEPIEMHARWLNGFFGGKWAEYRNWLVFFEMRLRSPLQRKALRNAVFFLSFPGRAVRYAYRRLKGA